MPDFADELRQAIEEHVTAFLPDIAEVDAVRAGKAIHDPIWGTLVLSPVEVSILDTPLMQRLRGVHQTSFAYLVYPAAHHTRFEHSLGVVVVAEKLLDALVADQEVVANFPFVEVGPNTHDRLTVRLAALLHDCGHSFLSHIGETQFENHQWIEAIRDTAPELMRPKAHEILSYLIVRSHAFKRFFAGLVEMYPTDARLDSVDLEVVADLIIGHAPPRKQYMADVINGSFDADKLDYLFRDAYFTGLRLALDIDRLLYAMTLAVVDYAWLQTEPRDEAKRRTKIDDLANDCRLRLVVRSSGVSALEQILFNKMQLTANIYQHQKVRASDAMLTCFMGYSRDHDIAAEEFPLATPVDFLKYTDWEWLYGTARTDPYLNTVTTRIRNRALLKRALVISRSTVRKGLSSLLEFQEDPVWPQFCWEIRTAILEKAKAFCPDVELNPHDIVIDLPPEPSFREAAQTVVLLPNKSLELLKAFFPTGSWLGTFFANKWQGHVFCPDNKTMRLAVSRAAVEVLRDHPDLEMEFTEHATMLAYLDKHQADALMPVMADARIDMGAGITVEGELPAAEALAPEVSLLEKDERAPLSD